MSYSDNKMGRERLAAAGLVTVVQGGVIAALVWGLAISVMPKAPAPPLETYNIKVPLVQPTEKPKPTPERRATNESIVHNPRPIVDTPVLPEMPIVGQQRPVDVTPIELVEIPKPAPTISNLASSASARGNVGEWFPQNSYPPAALRAQAEGRVGVALTVLASGRVGNCEVVATSGNADLDQATCRLAMKNGRFQAARDQAGNAVPSRTTLPSVRWRIEK